MRCRRLLCSKILNLKVFSVVNWQLLYWCMCLFVEQLHLMMHLMLHHPSNLHLHQFQIKLVIYCFIHLFWFFFWFFFCFKNQHYFTGEEQDASVVVDYTRYPIVLDGALDSLEIEGISKLERLCFFKKRNSHLFSQLGSVRPTKVDVSNTWRKKFQQSLLSEQEETTLDDDQLHTEKNAAFDLSNN